MNIAELREIIDCESNPILVATELEFFLSDSLEEGAINTYEGFWIADLRISLLRQGYTKTAWSYTVGFQHILSLIMLYVTARYFNEHKILEKYRGWLFEASEHLSENRAHYSLGLLNNIRIGDDASLLAELARVRKQRNSFNEGPYHTEVFPFKYLDPENGILAGIMSSQKELKPEIVKLIVDIEAKCA